MVDTQFPRSDAVWISDEEDLALFRRFLGSKAQRHPVLLMPIGSGLAPRVEDVLAVTTRRAHVVRLELRLKNMLSDLLGVPIGRSSATLFWPRDAEADSASFAYIDYLPKERFAERLSALLSGDLSNATPPTVPTPSSPGTTRAPGRRLVSTREPVDRSSATSSYRATFQVEGETLEPALEQLDSWLRSKKIPADLSRTTSGEHVEDKKRSRWTVIRVSSVTADAFHFEMVESTPDGVPFTTVMTVEERHGGKGSWVFLHVYNDGTRFCGTPRLASNLLRTLNVVDNGRRLRAGAQILTAADIDAFVTWMRDPARQLPVQILATDDRLDASMSAVRNQAAEWTKYLAGQSHVVVLDHDATRLFNRQIPDEFEAWPWTLRTYRPHIEFAGTIEARQQRAIRTERLATQGDRKIASLLVASTRAITQQYPVPKNVRRVQALLARLERAARVEQLESPAPRRRAEAPTLPARRPRVPSPAETVVPKDGVDPLLLELGDAVLQTFDSEKLTPEIMSKVMDLLTEPADAGDATADLEDELLALQEKYDELEEQASDQRDTLEELNAELLRAEREAESAQRQIDYLQQELESAGKAAAAYSFVDQDPLEEIEDILSVIEKARDLQYVVPTWDEDTVLEIAEYDNHGSVPITAWSALLTMEDYGRAKAEEGYDLGFQHFVEERGELVTRKRVAMRETPQTMDRWGEERRFKVPEEVEPSGSVLMEAHIKLTLDGANSPRMHFYDDTRRSGKIYVGYLGRHLTNTKTSKM